MDNDLLTLWLYAEGMSVDEIRGVISDLQEARDELAADQADADKEAEEVLEDLRRDRDAAIAERREAVAERDELQRAHRALLDEARAACARLQDVLGLAEQPSPPKPTADVVPLPKRGARRA